MQVNTFDEVTNEVVLGRDKKMRFAWMAVFDPRGCGTMSFPHMDLSASHLVDGDFPLKRDQVTEVRKRPK